MSDTGYYRKWKKCSINVLVVTSPESITINPSEVQIDVSNNKSIKLNAIITPDTSSINNNLTWSSSNENIATVNQNGVITGKADGKCEIKVVTDNGKEAICNLTVIGTEKPSVTIERNYSGRILTAGSVAEYRIIMNGNNISNIDKDKIKLKGSMANSSRLKIEQEDNEILVSVLIGEGVGTLGLEIDEHMLTNKAGKMSESTEIEEDYVFTLNETTSGWEETDGGCITVAVGVHNSFYIKSYDFYLNDTKKVRK